MKTVGFADDACILVRGVDPGTLIDQAQAAADQALCWGSEAGLKFNAQKTAVILFTHRRKIPKLKKIKIDGTEAEFQKSIKYLGITLDHKLNLKTHVMEKIKNAKRFLFNIRKCVGKLWGPSPKMMLWAYKAMARPMLSYGSVIWQPRIASCTSINKQLQRLQRLGRDKQERVL